MKLNLRHNYTWPQLLPSEIDTVAFKGEKYELE